VFLLPVIAVFLVVSCVVDSAHRDECFVWGMRKEEGKCEKDEKGVG
jgi:hypothetical protein